MAATSRTVLVTGAAGFLGRHLCRELVARGVHVRALLRSNPSEPMPAGIEPVYGDVLAEETLAPAMQGCEAVFHLAGRVLRGGQRDVMYALHVDGTAGVLRAMAATGARRMVLASTSGTIAVSKDPIVFGDDAPYASDVVKKWPYYASKIEAEAVAERMARRMGIELVTLRPSLLLGPDDFANSSTEDVRRIVRGDYPLVPRGGVSFLDVRDAAATFANAMDRAADGEKYLLGGANMSVRDFCTLVANVADVEPPIAELPKRWWALGTEAAQLAGKLGWIETPDRISVEMAAHYWYCDWSRACAQIGHVARPPTETLEDTVAWLQAWGDLGIQRDQGRVLRLPFRPRGS